jgi:hypothetical protein
MSVVSDVKQRERLANAHVSPVQFHTVKYFKKTIQQREGLQSESSNFLHDRSDSDITKLQEVLGRINHLLSFHSNFSI